jgi:hypothetical protein
MWSYVMGLVAEMVVNREGSSWPTQVTGSIGAPYNHTLLDRIILHASKDPCSSLTSRGGRQQIAPLCLPVPVT